jgi:FkbM family methyltransferase
MMLDFLRSLRAKSGLIDTFHKRLREPYYRALEFAYPKGIYISLPSGDRFRIQPRFLGMNLSNYEPKLVETFCSLIADGMTVIDVGAHVGIYSLLASAKVGPNGKVIAIEPSPANACLLRQHLSFNQSRNVEVIEAAVADKPGQVTFNYRRNATDPGSFANSMAYNISGESANVQVRTLDDVCSNLSPAVIKIDVEGAELLALRGAKNILAKHRPTVIVAVHPEPMRMLGTTPDQLVGYMNDLGYVCMRLDGSEVRDPSFEEVIFRAGQSCQT